MEGNFGPRLDPRRQFQGLFAVTPGGEREPVPHSGASCRNPEDMTMGDDGSLYYADYGIGKVVRLSRHGNFTPMLDKPGVNRVAIDSEGHVEAVDVGAALDQRRAPQGFSEIAIGDGSLWGEDRYVFDSDAGSLLRLLNDGSSEVLATGFFDELAEQPIRWWPRSGSCPRARWWWACRTPARSTLVPAPDAVTLAGLRRSRRCGGSGKTARNRLI